MQAGLHALSCLVPCFFRPSVVLHTIDRSTTARSATLSTVRQAPGKGMGLFATGDTPSGAVLHTWRVLRIPADNIDKAGMAYGLDADRVADRAIWAGPVVLLDPACAPARWMRLNHTRRTPNCLIRRVAGAPDHLQVVTIRAVKAGAEFMINYGGAVPPHWQQ